MRTGQVQIFSNQTAVFNHPDDYETKFRVRAYEFTYAPDWILKSRMYKALLDSNKIKLIESNSDIAKIEINGKIESKEINEALNNTENLNISDNDLQSYSEKSSKELYNICLEKGIQVESKKPKEYYIEKLIG